MKKLAVTGAISRCNAGSIPCPLMSTSTMTIDGFPVILQSDVPKTPFGICSILTAQANGNPVPCAKAFPPLWENVSTCITVNGKPAVTKDSFITCSLGGKITIEANPNQKVKVDR